MKKNHRAIRAALLACAILLAVGGVLSRSPAAFAEVTGDTGGDQPFDNRQPSLVLNEWVQRTGATEGDMQAAFVRMFATDFLPTSQSLSEGQILDLSTHIILFSRLGTTYGGDGIDDFALPNLVGRVSVGPGDDPFIPSAVATGQNFGADQVTLTVDQMPSHTHSLPFDPGVTDATGGDQPFDNHQASIGLHYVIAADFNVFDFPSESSTNVLLGTVAVYAGSLGTLPTGWIVADGSLLTISQNTALFSLLGTTYGGDGISNFALPDLTQRTAVGVDNDADTVLRGQEFGQAQTTLLTTQIDSHNHTLPPTADVTGNTGGSQPISTYQPSLGVHYIVALQGLDPRSANPVSGDVYVGEVRLFAGSSAPQGWAFAEGQLLAVAQNTLLFALLGDTFGGNGTTTFALPDLRGMAVLGSSLNRDLGLLLGDTFGDDTLTLTEDQLPRHNHNYEVVPEPASAVALAAFTVLLTLRRRRGG